MVWKKITNFVVSITKSKFQTGMTKLQKISKNITPFEEFFSHTKNLSVPVFVNWLIIILRCVLPQKVIHTVIRPALEQIPNNEVASADTLLRCFSRLATENTTVVSLSPKREMQSHKSGSHTRYDLKYHIVWITKYRKPIMEGSISELTWTGSSEMSTKWSNNYQGSCIKGSCSYFGILFSKFVSKSISSEAKRFEFSQVVCWLCPFAQTILGSVFMDTRLFCCDDRHCNRRGNQRLHWKAGFHTGGWWFSHRLKSFNRL